MPSDDYNHAAEASDSQLADVVGSFLLVRHPPVLARLRGEISTVVGDEGELHRAHIQKLHYLKCVLNESTTPSITLDT